MTKDKYIGIENELTSFKKDEDGKNYLHSYNGLHLHSFTTDDFAYLIKDRAFQKSDHSIRSSHGNGYYVDGSEIEIVTPPIVLNKGFATRLTDALVLGRNYVIENTPHLLHTGYSMHWNLSHDNANFDINTLRDNLINHLAVPFSLFGLTPLSCGFDIRTTHGDYRYEVMGDSITNVNQINATALLLGAYNLATEKNPGFLKLDAGSGGFPIKILSSMKKNYYFNALANRYSKLSCYCGLDPHGAIPSSDVQVQKILEIFYDWISPFVYKLGEHDEITNLEAFIKGEKKLEMDDIKYFDILKNNNGIIGGVYSPLEVLTSKGPRSQILTVTNKDTLKVPIEGELLGIYALNGMPNKISLLKQNNFLTESIDWDDISLIPIKDGEYLGDTKKLSSVKDIYDFAQKYTANNYFGGLDVSDLNLTSFVGKNIVPRTYNCIYYDSNKDNSI